MARPRRRDRSHRRSRSPLMCANPARQRRVEVYENDDIECDRTRYRACRVYSQPGREHGWRRCRRSGDRRRNRLSCDDTDRLRPRCGGGRGDWRRRRRGRWPCVDHAAAGSAASIRASSDVSATAAAGPSGLCGSLGLCTTPAHLLSATGSRRSGWAPQPRSRGKGWPDNRIYPEPTRRPQIISAIGKRRRSKS